MFLILLLKDYLIQMFKSESEVEDNSLIFEEEMSEDELNEIDESIND